MTMVDGTTLVRHHRFAFAVQQLPSAIPIGGRRAHSILER